MKRDIAYARAAIGRLNTNYRTGIDRFDSWIDYAIRDWERFIAEQTAIATEQGAIATDSKENQK